MVLIVSLWIHINQYFAGDPNESVFYSTPEMKPLLTAPATFVLGNKNVPEEAVIRRYYLGIKNLVLRYLPLVDEVLIMDNSLEESSKRLIARKNKNNP